MKGVRGIFRHKQGDEGDEELDNVRRSSSNNINASADSWDNFRSNDNDEGVIPIRARTDRGTSRATSSSHTRSTDVDSAARPSYRVYERNSQQHDEEEEEEEDEEEESMVEESQSHLGRPGGGGDRHGELTQSVTKARHIEKSAGTNRLKRILSRKEGMTGGDDDDPARNFLFNRVPTSNRNATGSPAKRSSFLTSAGALSGGGRISDPKNLIQVGNFASRVVVPALKVDRFSIGGLLLHSTDSSSTSYPETMQQETITCFRCQDIETTGTESVPLSLLQFPGEYKQHKRSLGLFGGTTTTTTKGRNRFRYVLIVRSTNKPLVAPALVKDDMTKATRGEADLEEGSTGRGGDYDAMFAPEEDLDMSKDLSSSMDADDPSTSSPLPSSSTGNISTDDMGGSSQGPLTTEDNLTGTQPSFKTNKSEEKDEISSFPVLVCMTLHSSGTAPEIRKLIRLDQLATVQDLHATVVQLAFRNGDTIRLDFGHTSGKNDDEYQAVEGSMDKERFIWSLLQVHAMLCVSVVERSALQNNAVGERTFLPPLAIRNLDRAELQYVATVNGFLRKSETLSVLLERQRRMMESVPTWSKAEGVRTAEEQKLELEEMDNMAYDLLMGNYTTRITLFRSDEERKDAEEVLNSTEWTQQLDSEDNMTAISIGESLGLMLQLRMRDLEAETCRRLIAWEDEKHYSVTGKSKFMDQSDERDSVDALALASLFKTLESLDTELQQMEEWLQERAAAIKPLTDDCADIEEENRQLEQQWKSYEMLGSEIRRLLTGLDIDAEKERTLKNPASLLVYDEEGLVDVDESENGVEQIYEAGKALQEAMEYPRRSGGMHLKAVSERAKGLNKLATTFCKQLAQIIVTIMEQFKTEVVAGSDYGKVSKSDTHSMIAKKVRDTQRKFQSALLGYLKLIEILAALSPEMLPALRDAYSEMVSEGILMKKRMKGYFQALPGKNAAYLNKAGKDLKDYAPFEGPVRYESVNARDIKAALTEMLPVIAREAYFTSALFGTNTRDQDGREKKRNFENTKVAVDSSAQNFRYYINRTCGILAKDLDEKTTEDSKVRGDPLLCLVASVYLNEVMENYIDREKRGGDHSLSLAYVRATILDLRKRADKQWVVWVDKQMEWIRSSDGVPLNGKRAGVFPSFVRFFLYIDHVLACCREGRSAEYTPNLAGIKVINYYMQKMATTLLDSLRECASRETTDKQYASNVMQMENTYFFTQSIKDRGPSIEAVFSKQVVKANATCKESTDAYLGWMIKREFTALHDLFSRISKLRKDTGDSEVSKHIPKAQFVRTLSKEANRDILKEKIGSMYSRMEKHLSEDGKILPVAWKALVKVLYEWFGRWEKMSKAIYRHPLNPTAVDVVRIAKAAGGGAKPKTHASGSEFAFKSILALGSKSKDAGEEV